MALLGSAVACGGDESGTPTLTWYINPDPNPPEGFEGAFGQAGIAERCSTEGYTIETELLPGSASEQRIQLARRLAADDPSIDLMSLDPVFTAEFADADFLEPYSDEEQAALSEGVLQGAIDGATWEDNIVVAPLWANTQVLWYRKSVTDEAGLDMTQPVTWEQIIAAASDNSATVGVQANRYEGYVVWINALITGAGGSIITDVEEGSDATVTIDSDAGTAAAEVVSQLASSPAAMADLSVSNEGTVLGPFGEDGGGFIVNWTFVYNNYATGDVIDDIGWARYPATVEGEESRPPIGGINIGIGAFSDHPDLAKEAVACMTSEEQQIQYAVETANMPAREAAYDSPELNEQFPEDLLTLWRESIETAGPRPATPYWSTVVNAVLGGWHPAASVDPESTPEGSGKFVSDVLSGDALS
ncbi:MAG: extracellular solute-binding protein [Actinomycetota bacterium]|nr:extracellular solute-binding protein [Actinomycetota bacterium]